MQKLSRLQRGGCVRRVRMTGIKGRQGSVLWLDLEEKSLLSEIYFMPVLCQNLIQVHFILDITK